MTINEFKEAMDTEQMQQEFAVFAAEKNAETLEEAIQAFAEFAASKGVVAPEGAQALSDDELEAAAGGVDLGDYLDELWEGFKDFWRKP